MNKSNNRVAVIMDGSRRNYDVAIALERKGCLERIFSDWFASPWSAQKCVSTLIRFFGLNIGKRMSERYSPHIPTERIKTNSRLVLRSQFQKRKHDNSVEFWKWLSEMTTEWVVKEGFGQANGLYGYIRNIDPALCELARERGMKVVAEQMIAPSAIEKLEYESQQAKWPDWERRSSTDVFNLVSDIEEETWKNVDKIVAPSQYVVDGLIKQGIDSSQIEHIPYPADFATHYLVDRSSRKTQLTVGFVGQINLRKNAPVFLETAKKMHSANIKFVMVGGNQLNDGILEKYRDFVQFTGVIPRSEVKTQLSSFDAFLFPSTCEGSAGAVLEAMATGLPILTTHNSGTLVTDGVDGFILEPDNIDGFIDRINQLCRDPDLRLELGRKAASRIRKLDLGNYGDEIDRTFSNC